MELSAPSRIAVIGAGLAGLACARTLSDAGHTVEVLDKSRGLGGRLATRRRDGFQFDHGAQYIRARSGELADTLSAAQDAGAAAYWTPRVAESAEANAGDGDAWIVGSPGMSALVRPLAQGLTLLNGQTVTGLSKTADGWSLSTREGGRFGPYASVVSAIPAPQALALLRILHPDFEKLRDVSMAPCWTGLFAFDRAVGAASDVLRPAAGPVGWAARDNTKPGRQRDIETWVVQATAPWSRTHLELEKGDVAPMLLRQLAALMAPATLPDPVHLDAHRWRYAFADRPLGAPFLHVPELGIIAAGDWCLGRRADAAFQSGLAAAARLLG